MTFLLNLLGSSHHDISFGSPHIRRSGGANPRQRGQSHQTGSELRPTQPGLMVKSPAATPMKSGLPSGVDSLGCLEPTSIQEAPGFSSTMGWGYLPDVIIERGEDHPSWGLTRKITISACVRNLPLV